MKQRLLLALLMLLTSAGFMKVDGQTIVLPKSETGEKVTLTFTGKFSASSYPIVYGTAKNEVKIVGTPGTTTVYELVSSVKQDTTYVLNNAYRAEWGEIEVTLDGKVSQFIASTGSENIAPHFSSLVFTNNDTLQTLNLAQASKIKTLNVSGNDELTTIAHLNALTELVTLNISYCGFTSLNLKNLNALEYLNVSNNKIESIGDIPASIKSLDISNNGYAASGANGVWDLSTRKNLAELKIDGNKLKIVKVTDDLLNSPAFEKGIQDFTTTALFSGIKANDNLDITNSISNLNIAPDAFASAESWMKYNDQTQKYDIDASNEANTIIPKNLVVYRFFDKNKNNVYVDGKYECVLVSEKGFRYRVHFTVEPAEVKLTRAELPNEAVIKVFNESNKEVFGTYGSDGNSVGVKQGENYKIDIDFTNASGYELSKFVLKGLEVIDGDLTRRPINPSLIVNLCFSLLLSILQFSFAPLCTTNFFLF